VTSSDLPTFDPVPCSINAIDRAIIDPYCAMAS
jgi:hypothetical protein